jgi:hypothetical protein
VVSSPSADSCCGLCSQPTHCTFHPLATREKTALQRKAISGTPPSPDEINRKAIRPQRGAQVAEAVADGRAEIGNTNLAEFVPHKGVKVIGPIPDSLGLVITYVGGPLVRLKLRAL